MKLKRALYLGYYLKELDREKFELFLNYTTKQTGKSKTELLTDILKSVFTYNISVLEYFQFHFYKLEEQERAKWAGTGYMYEYQLQMNPKSERHILDDKRLFHKYYADFFVHRVADANELEDPSVAGSLLQNPSGKIVFKASDGKCGAQVEIRNCSDFTAEDITGFMREYNYGLAEEFIRQHPEIDRLSPSGVNTVRIITQINDAGAVDLLGCRLRISVDSPVDNMAAGNLAAPIDESSGVVTGPGVYSDITKVPQEHHPVTGVRIHGFKVPFWQDILELCRQAALRHPENRSIGWDVVVTEEGPGLIEGNHDWCKLLWQLPVQTGLKENLEEYRFTTNNAEHPQLANTT